VPAKKKKKASTKKASSTEKPEVSAEDKAKKKAVKAAKKAAKEEVAARASAAEQGEAKKKAKAEKKAAAPEAEKKASKKKPKKAKSEDTFDGFGDDANPRTGSVKQSTPKESAAPAEKKKASKKKVVVADSTAASKPKKASTKKASTKETSAKKASTKKPAAAASTKKPAAADSSAKTASVKKAAAIEEVKGKRAVALPPQMIAFTKPDGPIGLGVEDAPGFPKVWKVAKDSVAWNNQIQVGDSVLEFNGTNTIGFEGSKIHEMVKAVKIGKRLIFKIKGGPRKVKAGKGGKHVEAFTSTVNEDGSGVLTFVKPNNGIGINIGSRDVPEANEYPYFEDIVPGGFADQKGGFEAGNRVTKINGNDTKGKSKNFCAGMIKAVEPGAMLTIAYIGKFVRVSNATKIRSVTIVRENGQESMGIGFKTENGVSVVSKVNGSGPGGSAGIVVGDEIATINGISADDVEHDEVVAMMVYGGLRIVCELRNAEKGTELNTGMKAVAAAPVESKSFQFRTVTITRASKDEKIGLGISSAGSESKVFSIMKDSPAEKSGLKKGEVLSSVNGVHVDHSSHKMIMNLLKNGGLNMALEVRNVIKGYDGFTHYAAIPNFFEGADEDGGGTLSWDECKAKGMTRQMFDAIDADGSGELDAEEFNFWEGLDAETKENLMSQPISMSADGTVHRCLHAPPIGEKCQEKAPLGTAFCMKHTCPKPGCSLWKAQDAKACELHLAPVRSMSISRQAKPETFGIEFETEQGISVINLVDHDSPAQKAGVTVGDQILSVNGVAIEGMDNLDVQRILTYGGLHAEIEVQRAGKPPGRCPYSGANGACRAQAGLSNKYCKRHQCPVEASEGKESKALFCAKILSTVTFVKVKKADPDEKLGLGFETKGGTHTINKIVSGGPAARVGIKASTVLSGINGVVCDGKTNDEVRAMLKFSGQGGLMIGTRPEAEKKPKGFKRKQSFIQGMLAAKKQAEAPRTCYMNRTVLPKNIGIGFVMVGEHHVVSRVINNTNASKAGIKVGQVIAAVNHVPCKKLPMVEISSMIKYGGLRVVVEVHDVNTGVYLTVEQAVPKSTNEGYIGELPLLEYMDKNPKLVRSVEMVRADDSVKLGLAITTERGLSTISKVSDGGLAAKYGVVASDIITAINMVPIDSKKTHEDVMGMLGNAGLTITLDLLNTKPEVAIVSMKKGFARRGSAKATTRKDVLNDLKEKKGKSSGMIVISRESAEERIGMGLVTDEAGVTSVSSCKKKSPAASAGIKRGVIITAINGVDLDGKDHDKIMGMLRNAGLIITLATKPKPKVPKESTAPKKVKRGSIGFDKAANAMIGDQGAVKQNPMFDADEEKEGFGVPEPGVDGEEGFGFDEEDRDAYRDVAPEPEEASVPAPAEADGYLDVGAEPEPEAPAENNDDEDIGGFGDADEGDDDEPEGFGDAESPEPDALDF